MRGSRNDMSIIQFIALSLPAHKNEEFPILWPYFGTFTNPEALVQDTSVQAHPWPPHFTKDQGKAQGCWYS